MLKTEPGKIDGGMIAIAVCCWPVLLVIFLIRQVQAHLAKAKGGK